MKKYFLLTLFFLSASASIFSQLHNSLEINLDMMYNKGYFHSTNFPQYGIKYYRAINAKSKIGVAFQKWTNDKYFFLVSRVEIYGKPEEAIGVLTARKKYKFIDCDYNWNLLQKDKIGSIIVSGGLSYAWGVDTYIDTAWTSPTPPYDIENYIYKSKNGKHFGVYPQVSYNYWFWKRHINLGLHFMCRKYFGIHAAQLNWGIRLGYSF